jgi:hypothetical protein
LYAEDGELVVPPTPLRKPKVPTQKGKMEALGNNWIVVLLWVFILGLKHGMDSDHVAAIDRLTRYNASSCPPQSRWAGFFPPWLWSGRHRRGPNWHRFQTCEGIAMDGNLWHLYLHPIFVPASRNAKKR